MINICEFLMWFTKPEASNLGGFLSGFGTFILALVAGVGLYSLRLWRTQKYEETLSEIAASVLKDLPKQDHLYWLNCALFTPDLTRDGYKFVDKISVIKDYAKGLFNPELNQLFDDLEKNSKLAASNVARYYHVSTSNEDKVIVYDDFNAAAKNIEESYTKIQKNLRVYVVFKKVLI